MKEVRPEQPPPPPPLIIREQPQATVSQPPIFLRERPPIRPALISGETSKNNKKKLRLPRLILSMFIIATRYLPPVPVPPRSVIIERFPVEKKPGKIVIFLVSVLDSLFSIF